jgi:hypothetical protein
MFFNQNIIESFKPLLDRKARLLDVFPSMYILLSGFYIGGFLYLGL